MAPRLAGLTKLTLETAPTVCHECTWWQSRGRRAVDKDRWMEKLELEFGSFGTVYYDSDGRVLGSMQYGPSSAFPRAQELPAGPPSDDAMLVTCAYLVDQSSPWVLQSLFLAAIGEARDRGARALEAFSYRYAEGETAYERFRVHKTVFPQDFLADFGFQVRRVSGRVGLARLELGGLQPVEEGRREKVLRVVQEAFGIPEPVPAPRP
ncbi:MAG TPA: hypothetical protein VFA05_05185 [Gaiellaceae bacterium]|nr:hypothetical protein [Gaiellaceae bacterium]